MGAFFAAYRAPALQPEAALAVSGWHGSLGLAWFVGLTGLADRLTGLTDRLARFVGLTGLADRPLFINDEDVPLRRHPTICSY